MNGQINYFLQKYDITLNEQQKNAVCETDGAVLLLAVPGSGKTTVLVARLGYMIYEKGIAPENILTMTYTVAAANDMKRRFISFFGEEYADRLSFRTINGVCQSILNYYTGHISTRAPFELVTDEKRLGAILTDIYRELAGEYPSDGDLKELKTSITYAKNGMLTEDEIKKLGTKDLPFYEIYTAYNAALRRMRLMDYDDQLKYALNVLTAYPQLLQTLRGRYRYLCVDEAQDTSKIQHEIIKLLASESGNIFMVGDEDQSIYGFRAAYPRALLDFEKTYPGAKTLFIEENFRSDGDIVSRADRFIARNTGRQPKHMITARERTDAVSEVKLVSMKAQYAYLMKVARDCKTQTAVLYKDNETAVPLIDLLEREGIGYGLKGGDFVFFSNRIVRDIRDIMTYALDGTRYDLFLRFYIKLGLYAKKDVVGAAADEAAKTGNSILAVLAGADVSEYVRSRARTLMTNFAVLGRESASKALFRIENTMGYADYIGERELDRRKLTILEMIAKNEPDIASFLDRLDALSDLIKNKKSDPDASFLLSTIHSSKGLEYDSVYIADACSGLLPETLPGAKASKEEKELFEEERRLFYVAATRAKKKLTVFTYADRESLFANEFFHAAGQSDGGKTSSPAPITAPWSPVTGERIYHKKYGSGEISSVSCDGMYITVSFADGEKMLLTDVLLSNGLLFREI